MADGAGRKQGLALSGYVVLLLVFIAALGLEIGGRIVLGSVLMVIFVILTGLSFKYLRPVLRQSLGLDGRSNQGDGNS